MTTRAADEPALRLDRRWEIPARLLRDGLIDWLALDPFGVALAPCAPFAEDLALLFAHALAAQGGLAQDTGVENIAALRLEAEQKLRRRTWESGTPVTLAAIHESLPARRFKLGPAERAALEQTVAREALRPNPDAFDIIARARAHGVKIALIADTPHDGDFTHALLPESSADLALVSSEWRGDFAGEVFTALAQKAAASSRRILYIGSDAASVAQARKTGLRTIFLPRHTLEKAEILSHEWMGSGNRARLLHPTRGDFGLTSLRARLGFAPAPERLAQENLRPWFDWGATVMGPLLTLFADWTAERARALAAETSERPVIHCFMREGHLLARLLRSRAPDVEARETWINRHAALKACLAGGGLEDMIHFLDRPSPPTVRQACAELRLPLPAHLPEDTVLDGAVRTAFYAYATGPLAREALEAESGRVRKGLLAHIAGQADLKSGGRFFIMDLGYNGTTQRALQRLFDGLGEGSPETYGFYLATSSLYGDMKPALAAEGWLVHGGAPIKEFSILKRSPEAIEQSCMPPEGTLIEHDETGRPVCEKNPLPPWQMAQTKAVQEGVLAFAALCPALPASDPHLVRQMRALMTRAIGRPTLNEATRIGNWIYDENFGSGKVRALACNPALGPLAPWPMERLLRLPNPELPWIFAAARRESSVLQARLYAIRAGEADPDLFDADDGEPARTLVFADFGAGFSGRNVSVIASPRSDLGIVQASCGILCRKETPVALAVQCGAAAGEVFALRSLKLKSHDQRGNLTATHELATPADFARLDPAQVEAVRPGLYRKRAAGGALIWRLPPLGTDVRMLGVEISYVMMRAHALPARGTQT